MYNPYQVASPHAFWRNAVSNGLDLTGIFTPKFHLGQKSVFGTAGSCFAQNIGRNLASSGCTLYDAEPAPRHLTRHQGKRFGYGIYSARYGNVYTARQFVQLLEEAEGISEAKAVYWPFGKKWLDALRPSVEPEGLTSLNEVAAHRSAHLQAVRRLLRNIDVFVFTLGMTEGWEDKETGRVLPTCPGVVAGNYSETTTQFINFSYSSITDDLEKIRTIMTKLNPEIRIILTVSPVPLTATASGSHVLTATCHSKSILRAAAGDFAESHLNVDYFPSYDIVTSVSANGCNYMPNLRDVRPEVVSNIVNIFMQSYGLCGTVSRCENSQRQGDFCNNIPRHDQTASLTETEFDVVCEEALVEGFSS